MPRWYSMLHPMFPKPHPHQTTQKKFFRFLPVDTESEKLCHYFDRSFEGNFVFRSCGGLYTHNTLQMHKVILHAAITLSFLLDTSLGSIRAPKTPPPAD